MLKTGTITFNIADRARQFRGQERNFDIPSVVRLINGNDVQERVKKGDMIGYFGHWPREKFGLDPAEGGILDGKQFSLEPALRTVSIKAHPNGNIDHEVEFLDTSSGRIASRIYGSKAYGFSSAIRARPVGGKSMASAFFGFDFVKEPNYSENRGYVLDGVDGEEAATLDAVAEREALFDAVNAMLDDKQKEIDTLQHVIKSMTLDNTQLIGMLSKKTGKTEVVLDGVMQVGRVPARTHVAIFDDAGSFLDAKLDPFKPEKPPESVAVPEADAFFERKR